jgi:hypothetical protein
LDLSLAGLLMLTICNKNDNDNARMMMALSSTSPSQDPTQPCALNVKGYLVLANINLPLQARAELFYYV